MGTVEIWLFLGSLTVTAGALWQMWIESGKMRDQLAPISSSLDELTAEQRGDLEAAQGVKPWNLIKRRRVRELAKDVTFAVLTPAEKRMLLVSDSSGWAWALVCAGGIATTIGAAMAVWQGV